MTEHTPGPWRAGKPYLDDEGFREIPIFADVKGVACTPAAVCLQFPTLGKMQEANARLIAASPELLEACKAAEAAMSIIEPRGMKAQYLDTLERVRAAIRTACDYAPLQQDSAGKP